jgi:hypothetical protein
MRKNDLPPLDALRAFDAAARHLSFTRAAEELFVTQSAVSKQVIALESALATRLFERKTRALALTVAGERLRRATVSAFAELRAAATELRGGDEPTVTLATTQAFASFWLIPRLAEFRRRASRHRHPHLGRHAAGRPRARPLRCRGALPAGSQRTDKRAAPVRRHRVAGAQPGPAEKIGKAAAQAGRPGPSRPAGV